MSGSVVLQSLIAGVLGGSLYALIALGFNLIFGIMKIVNFAHGHLVVLGMWLTIVLWRATGIDPYLLLIITVPTSFCIGVIIHKVFVSRILDAPELNQFTLTLGLMLLLENLMLVIFGGNYAGVTTWYTSKSIMLTEGISINYARLFAFLTTCVSVLVLYFLFYKTHIGKAMRAAADEKDGAELQGINTGRVFAFAFGLSSVFAAVAGAATISYVVVNPAAGTNLVIKSFIIVVFGGIGSIWGTVIGGLLLGIIENLGIFFMTPSLASASALVILVIVIIVKPTGLLGKA